MAPNEYDIIGWVGDMPADLAETLADGLASTSTSETRYALVYDVEAEQYALAEGTTSGPDTDDHAAQDGDDR